MRNAGDDDRPDWMTGSQNRSRPESQASSLPSRGTARNSVNSASSSQLNEAVTELKGFNTQLKDELQELKGYLKQTNERLKTLEADGVSTGRQSTVRTGHTRTERTRATSRSDVSSVISDARAAIA